MPKALQFHFRNQAYVFTFKLGIFVFCALFFIFFCLLANWQFKRYHYKQELLQSFQQQLNAKAQPFQQLIESVDFSSLQRVEKALQFQRVKLAGFYLNDQTMLLQSRFYQHQLGFEVLTPFKIFGDKKLLIIDRGWIKALPNPQQLPKIVEVSEKQQVSGYLKFNEYQYIIGSNILDKKERPMVMQKIDFKQISQITHQVFYPFILRLDGSIPNGYVRDWVILTVVPERHLGYAVQWSAMAFVILIAFLCFSFQREENK